MFSTPDFSIPDPQVATRLEPGEAEGGRFSVSPVNGDRPGNLLLQKDAAPDMGRLVGWEEIGTCRPDA